jgi:hypothetical protein
MKLLTLGVFLLVATPTIGADAPVPAATPPANTSPSKSNADLLPAVNTSATSAAANAKPELATKAVPATTAPQGVRRAPASTGPAVDRLDLDTTQITGNRELPRVLYVVPWKRSDLGDLTGRPANSLLDEVLAPVDRDVFRRQNKYYDALRPDTSTAGASAGAEGEK